MPYTIPYPSALVFDEAGGTKQAKLDEGILYQVKMIWNGTVTDAGIGADETFDGLVSSLKLKDHSGDVKAEALRDEMRRQAILTVPGLNAVSFDDSVPVTTVLEKNVYVWRGPWDFRGGAPTLELRLRPLTDEFPGGTDLDLDVSFEAVYLTPEEWSSAFGNASARLVRDNSASSTKHVLTTPKGRIRRIYLVADTDDVLDEVTITPQPVNMPGRFDDPDALHTTLTDYKGRVQDAAQNEYMIGPVDLEGGGQLSVAFSSASALSVFYAVTD